MQRFKVVHVVEAFTGGVFSYFKDLAYVFDREMDMDTTIIYSKNRQGLDQGEIRAILGPNIKLIEVSMYRELSFRKDFYAFLKLRKLIARIQPDIVHLHSSKAGVLGRAAHFFCRSKALLYYAPHGYSFLRKDVSEKMRGFYYTIEKWAQYLNRGTTIACGDTEYKLAKKLGPAVLIRNGVLIDKVRAYKKIKKEQSLIVGTVGRLSAQRNPAFFNALALANPHIRFLWIGDGELSPTLTAPNIKCTGWFESREEGMGLLNTVDVYVQTSLWEGLPIALLEAMALEKPIIATKVIGNKDIVSHESTGFLCETLEDFNARIHQLSDDKLRAEMGSNALKRCEELFNSTKNLRKLAKLYKTDLRSKRGMR